MLVQFTVENFLSFKDEVTFSMLAASSDQQHLSHVVNNAAGKDKSLLRAAAIYGANAAGKSNLIKAVRFAKELILRGTRSGQKIPIPAFRLENSGKRPSKFEFIFTYQNILYSYGFKLNSEQIIEEWLYATPNKREITYFERTTSDKQVTKVEFGPALKSKSGKQEQFLDFVAQGTRYNQLFLTEAVDRNVVAVTPVNDWFKKVLLVISAESQHRNLEINAYKNAHFTDFLGTFLRAAGTGIDGIATEETALDFDQYLPDMPNEVREEMVQQITNAGRNEGLIIQISPDERYLLIKGEQGQPNLVQLKMQHRTKDGRLVNFSIEEESEGTQRLIHLLPVLLVLKEEREKTIFLDELDRRLHPLLSRLFVEAALDCNDENRQSQLIFTTHDTNLLDLDILRRDEIWFVEKDESGSSHLYSLAEFKIRPDLKIEKGYLNGRFGAIPFIGDICNLGWTSSEKALVEA